MRGADDSNGGFYHGIIGTLQITGIASAISIPLGLFTAIFLVEYNGGWVARAVTFLVDVMTGIPSIVAGLFAYSVFQTLDAVEGLVAQAKGTGAIRWKAHAVFNLMNTSVALGLVPATEEDHERMVRLRRLFESFTGDAPYTPM